MPPKEVVYKPSQPYDKKYDTPKIRGAAYTKSFLDYLRENGKLVHGFKSFQGSDEQTLYTCPVGKEFYLVFVCMTAKNSAAISIPTIDLEIENAPIFTINPGTAATGTANQTANFPIPVKFVAGERLRVYNNRVNCWVRTTFMGYEVSSTQK